ncbi:hypothetical protein [[Acidovorax] ebreus]|uniref:hypothetical protein n=1 Tax=Diaphorobacter sp. LI3 TaxID=2952886 RepID=UPI00205D9EBA|nr:hypothetical protein MRB47_14880 [Diaphorobacter sp. LI3]
MSKIIRAPRPQKNWTEIANSVLRDSRLSYRARGILARLLSNADGFAMNADDLARESAREGRDAVRAGLAELASRGYLQREKRQDERGRWLTELYIFDTPQPFATDVGFSGVGSPTPENPAVGDPGVGKPGATRKTREKNQEETPPPPRAHAHTQGDQQTGSLPADGGGGDENFLCEAARKAKLPPATSRRVDQLAEGATPEQQALLALLLEQLPALAAEGKVKAPAGYALRLAKRAAAGELTPPASAAPAPAPVQVYQPEPRGLTTPEGLAAGKASIAALQAKIHGSRHHGPGAATPRVDQGAQ